MTKLKKCILLVEDNVALREGVSDFLREQGYDTLMAGTLREAWELIRAHRPSVCVLDLNLPDGNGMDLLGGVARQGLGMRVIVMTALPQQQVHQRMGGGCLAGWVAKPVAPAHLLSLVQAAMPAAGQARPVAEV